MPIIHIRQMHVCNSEKGERESEDAAYSRYPIKEPLKSTLPLPPHKKEIIIKLIIYSQHPQECSSLSPNTPF